MVNFGAIPVASIDNTSPKYHPGRKGKEMSKLLHVYTSGRFGPERHLGFVECETTQVCCWRTGVAFDIVKSVVIPRNFFRNPLEIANIHDYYRWCRKQKGSK